jgi:WD40 repeat protein
MHALLARLTCRTAFAVLLAVFSAAGNTSAADDSGKDSGSPQNALFGDPLPSGAIARMGTVHLRHNGSRIDSVKFALNGKVLVSLGSDRVLRLWETTTGKPLRSFGKPGFSIAAFDTYSDGQAIAAACEERSLQGPKYFVRIWNVETGARLNHLDIAQRVNSLTYSPDQKFLAGISQGLGRINVWDLTTILTDRFVIKSAGGSQVRIAFAPNDPLLAVAVDRKRIKVWNLKPVRHPVFAG